MNTNKKRIIRNKENSNQSIGGLLQELTPRNRDINRSAFLGFLQSLAGAEIDVFMNEGFTYRATYLTATPFEGRKLQLVLKAAKKLNETESNSNSNDFGSTLILPFDQIKYITVVKSKLASTSQVKELETDVMLSKRTNIAELDGRDLQLIDSSWLSPETSASLETRYSSIGNWNQFEANKRLYNYQDTYDENIYTKKLDRSTLTREQVERAERIALQIENTSSNNFHLREERGQVATGEEENYDEEDRYSGVLRQPSPGANSKSFTKSKGSPQGPWRRISVPTQQSGPSPNTTPTNANQSRDHHTNNSNNNNNHIVRTNSGSSSTSTSVSALSSSSTWGSKSTIVENSYKNALQSGEPKSIDNSSLSSSSSSSLSSINSLPPGFGKTPSTEGGYFKSNIDASNIATNISFYGTIEPDESDKKETDSKTVVSLISTTTNSSVSSTTTIASTTSTITSSEKSQEISNTNIKSDTTATVNNNDNNNNNIQLTKESVEQSTTSSDNVKSDTINTLSTSISSSSSSSSSTITTTTTNVTNATETTSISSTTTATSSSNSNGSKTQLRATATAWVPNVHATSYSPSSSSSSTPTSIATSQISSANISTTQTTTVATNNIPSNINSTNTTPNNYNNHNSHHNNHHNNYHGNNQNGNLNNGYSGNNRGPKQNKRNPRNQNNNYHNQNNQMNNNNNNNNNNISYDPNGMYGTAPMQYLPYEHQMYTQPIQEMQYMTIPYDQNYPVEYYHQPVFPMMVPPPQQMPIMIPYQYETHPEQQVYMVPNPQYFGPHMILPSVPVASDLVGIDGSNVAVAPGLTDTYKMDGQNNDGN